MAQWIASSCPSISYTTGTFALHSSLFFIATPSESHHLDNERERINKDGRLRRLEKTVEALSHGLILALTQLKSESGGRSGDVPRAELHGASGTSPSECDEEEETAPGDATNSLSITLARMGLSENSAENFMLHHLPLDD